MRPLSRAVPTLVTYTAREGAEAELLAALARKWAVFQTERLAKPRRIILRDPQNPCVYVEYFEWSSAEDAARAHDLETVRAVWDALDAATIGGRWEGIRCVSYELVESWQ